MSRRRWATRRRVLQPLRVDPEGTLSEGLVIETSLLARIFGIRVLRIEGTVSVAPAQVSSAPSVLSVPAVPVISVSDGHLGVGLETAAALLRDARTDLGSLPARDVD